MSLLLLLDDGLPFPRSLFSAGEQGIWLDPSDFSTLFQDSAGTTPVTAVGQPVGLALDKRLGLALGVEKIANGAIGLQGAATAATYNTSTGAGSATRVDAGNQSFVTFTALSVNNHLISITNTGAVTLFIRQGVGIGATVYTIAAGQTTTSRLLTTGGAFAVTCDVGTATFAVNSVREIAGNHAYQTTSASRPTLQQDSNGMYYLSFDGTDDGMATPSINFTGTDKMTVWAGAKANSAAANSVLFELSTAFGAGNPGSMAVLWPRLPYAVNFGLAGTGAASRSTSAVADTGLRVISCAFDISKALTVDEITPRVNGAAPSLLTIDLGPAGTGNFGNYPLYIGRRGGTSIPFNGRIYQLIVRGAESNDGQIAAGEAWVNSKTRAY